MSVWSLTRGHVEFRREKVTDWATAWQFCWVAIVAVFTGQLPMIPNLHDRLGRAPYIKTWTTRTENPDAGNILPGMKSNGYLLPVGGDPHFPSSGWESTICWIEGITP
jgi:hypothetical protein